MHTRCNAVCETETEEVTVAQTMFQVKIKSMFDFIDVFGHHEVPVEALNAGIEGHAS